MLLRATRVGAPRTLHVVSRGARPSVDRKVTFFKTGGDEGFGANGVLTLCTSVFLFSGHLQYHSLIRSCCQMIYTVPHGCLMGFLHCDVG
jgi:hypothetical protein